LEITNKLIVQKELGISRLFLYGLIPISTAIDIKLFWAFPANWRVALFVASPRHPQKRDCGLFTAITNAASINNK